MAQYTEKQLNSVKFKTKFITPGDVPCETLHFSTRYNNAIVVFLFLVALIRRLQKPL